jgi:uncharacterized membrane protein YcaP (DUF421 family)
MSSLNLTEYPALQKLEWRLSRVLHVALIGVVLAIAAGAVPGDDHLRVLPFRAISVYAIVFFVLRLSGKRTLAQVTTFDFVLLLILSEATQQALIGDDTTVSGAAVVIGTLVAMDLALSYARQWWRLVDVLLEGEPVQLVDDGKVIDEAMANERVDLDDVVESGRRLHGLEGFEHIKHAVIERGGNISIVPRSHVQ